MSTLQRFRVLTWYYGEQEQDVQTGAGRGRRCGGMDEANYSHREKIGGDEEGVA
jgi:hypothetical protein